jgi:hypothetical protein
MRGLSDQSRAPNPSSTLGHDKLSIFNKNCLKSSLHFDVL